MYSDFFYSLAYIFKGWPLSQPYAYIPKSRELQLNANIQVDYSGLMQVFVDLKL